MAAFIRNRNHLTGFSRFLKESKLTICKKKLCEKLASYVELGIFQISLLFFK